MKMEFVKAKTILTKVNYGNDWYGIDGQVIISWTKKIRTCYNKQNEMEEFNMSRRPRREFTEEF